MLRDSTQSLVRAIQKKDENTQSPIARISKVSTNKYFLIETSMKKFQGVKTCSHRLPSIQKASANVCF